MLSKSKAKYIQSLGHKKQRDQEGLFIAEGPKIVSELLSSVRKDVKELYAVASWIENNKSSYNNIEVVEVSEQELERISQLKTPNEVLAIVRQFDREEKVVYEGKISLVLDTIQDPGNLGTIIRIADWFGVPQIICSMDCVDVYNPKVVQATMGSIGRVKVFYTNLIQSLPQGDQLPIYACTLGGSDISSLQQIKEGLIIIGNESKGIQDDLIAMADHEISIPRKGKAESLNAAVALGIVLSRLAGG
jgi:TrmH family RNA methyltransferase